VSDKIQTAIPHSDWGDGDCWGCLVAVERDGMAVIFCNECSAIVRTVPKEKLQPVLNEMELDQGFASEICPHCGAVNVFPGFTEMKAFVCMECGTGVLS
jgi:hypothetical protein